MRKFLGVAVILLIGASNINGQVIINSKFKPLTYEEIMLSAMAENTRRKQFEEYVDKAYERLNHNDYSGFISYSNYALQTGWYNSKLYYDRGLVYIHFKEYKLAKKELSKSLRKGYEPARKILVTLKQKQKNRNL